MRLQLQNKESPLQSSGGFKIVVTELKKFKTSFYDRAQYSYNVTLWLSPITS
ncbi:MAG: hypothetical protein K0R52_411 [Alphaproteobacteria bacterium]|jgi:hypothetical protein|nr:hypothetical protein [Alphaproteobacteria bacterium]